MLVRPAPCLREMEQQLELEVVRGAERSSDSLAIQMRAFGGAGDFGRAGHRWPGGLQLQGGQPTTMVEAVVSVRDLDLHSPVRAHMELQHLSEERTEFHYLYTQTEPE